MLPVDRLCLWLYSLLYEYCNCYEETQRPHRSPEKHFQSDNTFIFQSKRFWLIIREYKYHLLIVNECYFAHSTYSTSSPSMILPSLVEIGLFILKKKKKTILLNFVNAFWYFVTIFWKWAWPFKLSSPKDASLLSVGEICPVFWRKTFLKVVNDPLLHFGPANDSWYSYRLLYKL